MQELNYTNSEATLKLGPTIEQLCLPLFKAFNMNFFSYIKVLNDGSRISMSNDSQWLQYYFAKQYQKESFFTGKEGTFSRGRYTVHDLNSNLRDNVVIKKGYEFGMHHGLTIFEKHEEYDEYFHFMTNEREYGINDFYINNFDAFDRFAVYFKNVAESLILNLKPFNPIEKSNEIIIHDKTQDERISSFYNDIKISTWRGVCEDVEIKLCKREIECLILYLKGMTVKEVARKLFLSHRTIEYYLSNIKQKFDSNFRSTLLKKVLKTTFARDFGVFK